MKQVERSLVRDIGLKRTGMGANGIGHQLLIECPKKLLERHGVHGLLTNAAGKRQLALARGDAELAAGCTYAPTRTREKAKRVERPLAELHFIEQDESGFLANGGALIVRDSRHDSVNIVGGAVEQRGDQLQIGLKVEFDKRIAGDSPADFLGGVCFAYASRTTDEEGA